MLNLSKNETVLCSTKVREYLTTPRMILEMATVTLVPFGARSNLGFKRYNLKLDVTSEALYIEEILNRWNTISEDRYTDKIFIKDIKAIEVINKKEEEFMKITINNNKTITFARNNEEQDDIGAKIADIIYS